MLKRNVKALRSFFYSLSVIMKTTDLDLKSSDGEFSLFWKEHRLVSHDYKVGIYFHD